MNKKNNSFMFYPEITDKDFNEKIYLKKEFRDTFVKEPITKEKLEEKKKRDFVLDPPQVFLKNYISPDTPYNGVLVFHGTGVGKTCTAISIAEGFKSTLKNINKKILIITTIKANFIKGIYNFEAEKHKVNPEDVVQCTGREYDLGVESAYLTQAQKEKEILKLIKSYYQFFGYRGFANYIIENTNGWKGEDDEVNEKIKAFISKEFDDRVIIIDEIQNIKTDVKELSKSTQLILQAIIKYAKNVKLVLMSATPMFDRPDEIIFYINLLLENDGREKINKSDIFNSKDGTLKEGAEERLKELFRGYVSYVRSEKPYVFPFRVYPENAVIPKIEYYADGDKISKDKQIRFTKLVLCPMEDIQLKTYNYYLNKMESRIGKRKNKKNNNENNNNNNNSDNSENNENEKRDRGLVSDLTNISNIVYPSNNEEKIGTFSKSSVNSNSNSGHGGYYKTTKVVGTKKRTVYKYQEHAIFNKDTANEAPFADEKHLAKYSTKFATLLETIKRSKGLILIYISFIEQGIIPLALMLEQNGFTRECIEGEEQLLDYPANKLKKGGKRKEICYLCGNEASNPDHHNEKSKNYHIFKRAKYIMYFPESKDIIKIKREEAVSKFSSRKNKYGEEVKIFIGTKAISEGLNFRMIRQVHILSPWYNLSRNEQIIGRAIRNKSHNLLLPEERNVEIYQYASVFGQKKLSNHETIDLKYYRIAENKDVIIKKITRIMKESAIDCVLFKNINVINDKHKEIQVTSSGNIVEISIDDKPCTALCDYETKCDYNCVWEPNPRINYPVNTDTYNIKFSSNDILKVKKEIKYMFKSNIVYHLSLIEKYIMDKHKDIDILFIYSALEQLANNKNEIVYDKFSRKGYIIYRGDYYVFQPFDLERDELPIIYRTYPLSVKPEYVDLELIEYENENKNNNENKAENMNLTNINREADAKVVDKITTEINNTYTLHVKLGSNKKNYLQSVIGFVMSKLSFKDEVIFIKNILSAHLRNKNEEYQYTNDIINYLNANDRLINFYSEVCYIKDKIKNNLFVGFIVDDNYFILDSIDKSKNTVTIKNNLRFINCPKDIIVKVKAYRNIVKRGNKADKREFNPIYGMIENKKFKIIDKTEEENILTRKKTKSKRSVYTGRMCSTFHIDKLIALRDKLGMYKVDGKRKAVFYCDDIELFFRYMDLTKEKNKRWFITK